MAYFAKVKKEDLRILCEELGLTPLDSMKEVDLRDLITKDKSYDEEFTKALLTTIQTIKQREQETLEKERTFELEKLEQQKLEKERAFELEKLEKERAFELEKLRLALPNQTAILQNDNNLGHDKPRVELAKLIPRFQPNNDDMGLFLTLFERQLKFLKIPEENFVTYLISSLPSEIAKLIAREPEEKSRDYGHIKAMLLKRFKLSAEKFRILFSQHRKSQDITWKDFFFEIRTYYEGWLTELNIENFEQLKDLMITDQIKKKCAPEYKEHFLDVWADIKSPSDLVEKLDSYDNLRTTSHKNKSPVNFHIHNRNKTRETSVTNDYGKASSSKSFCARKPNQKETWKDAPHKQSEDRPTFKCYGCGAPGYIKAKCPTCTQPSKTEIANFGSDRLYNCSSTAGQVAVLKIYINDKWGTACADSGASHSIAGETLYNFLQEQGVKFQKSQLTMSLADGHQSTVNVYKTCVTINIQGRSVPTNLIALPYARGNRTLLGTDFLQEAGVVLDVKNMRWYFDDKPSEKFPFAEEANIESILNSIQKVEVNSCFLRENEGKNLTEAQRSELSTLLKNHEDVFQPGGEATPFIEHHINTGTHPPVSVPPYRMPKAKKEVLKKEIEDLLEQGIIEECESPYAAPVVLIPKPNGSVRLCIDYRRLNANTITDSYPLPRIDDLLHEARHTPYMSTIDLKSGYYQVNVYPPDRDKTAFTCPFGTYRFLKMPFGLKNAPATFQRLIDNFRRSLCDILVLSYLDDIIILSQTFEEHMDNLKAVFEKLLQFKLRANREKCNFACPRVKYLGHWITGSGIEVDPDKTAAIQKMPAPRNIKQVQSFLQTCSWYRRFIPNFSKIAKPLSDLTKKNVQWKWKDEEESAFQALRQSLVSPPVLKQVEEHKPFIIRTDASNYALGAVLIQGQGAEEHPIEYASRLLNPAERNYSTTEREALAVVWALNKFRGYVEGHQITVASDHQPLKWLMTLKSPSGRLARWALQIQSFNLNMEYIPGKANVIADMLSRPICKHEDPSCEACTVSIDVPARNPKEIREEQLKDDDLRKIVQAFENVVKETDFANWTDRGYLMNQGVLYRYAPDSESEDAQLVVPTQERGRILQEYHDAPTAGHYGSDGTYHRISKRYYWTGMRKYITDYVKNCFECSRYKASNQKPAGLLQTPIYSQRFETLAIDLFGPLPETQDGKKWVFIVEDCSTRWVELFALPNATAKECATTLLEEVFLRYGLPRRLISDNGTQFVSAVMQQICFLLDIKQVLIPVYHPQANPVERKNRDLKPRLAILVRNEHRSWAEKLPLIRFAMNTAKCETTDQTAAFLQFGRELRTTDDVTHDLRTVITNDNFVPEITPYLKRFAQLANQVKDRVEQKQDSRKQYADKSRRPGPNFAPGDHVWITSHPVSKAKQGKSAKFMPRRDGPYVVLTQRSPTTYEVANPASPAVPLGVYHASALRPCSNTNSVPVIPLRKRGRPRKMDPGSSTRR